MPASRIFAASLFAFALIAVMPGRAWPEVVLPTQTGTTPTGAQAAAELSDLLKIGPLFDVMRLEGLDYGGEMRDELFDGQGGGSWDAVVRLIYDPVTMRRRFDSAFAQALNGQEQAVAEATAFFSTELGQRILTLEVEARRSMLDEAVSDAAKAQVEDMSAAQDPRIAALTGFAEANDLVEANVTGALNANLAFFQGLAEVGALAGEMTEEQMLSDVWAQEDDVRAETTEWLYSFMVLAYGPLTDDELQAYTAFSETDAGQVLNTSLFVAFDVVFQAISHDLGLAAARQFAGDDI